MNTTHYLSDFWKFDLIARKWEKLPITWSKKCCDGLKKTSIESEFERAGHTMTFDEEDNIILLIGGYSSSRSFPNQVLVYSLTNKNWQIFKPAKDKGVDIPTVLYGHSTVYHLPSHSFFIYGGIIIYTCDSCLGDSIFSLDKGFNIVSYSALKAYSKT